MGIPCLHPEYCRERLLLCSSYRPAVGYPHRFNLRPTSYQKMASHICCDVLGARYFHTGSPDPSGASIAFGCEKAYWRFPYLLHGGIVSNSSIPAASSSGKMKLTRPQRLYLRSSDAGIPRPPSYLPGLYLDWITALRHKVSHPPSCISSLEH